MSGSICPVARMEKLLLSTDGSQFSESATRNALSLAKKCSSKLIALSVVKTNLEFEINLPQAVEEDEKRARGHLESIKERASKEGIDCEIVVTNGEEPYQEIVNEAINHKVDIIIMGTHGQTGILRLMMGSVTARVISHAPCNVLVVPLNAQVECGHILIATDGSKYSEAAAQEAISIAKRCQSSLIAVSVASSDIEIKSAEQNVKKILDVGQREGITIEGLTIIGRAYEAIVETAKQKHVDLIVVGSHGRTGVERLYMGSVAERVVGHSNVAVEIVTAKRPS
jgi:nucleotide-binding universal stress UspA family protein